MLALRESKIEERLKLMEKRAKEYEKKKRLERKQVMQKMNEKQETWAERRTKV